MAGPLTWRDVSIPNFGGVADSQRTAALLLDRGLGGLAESLGRFQQAQFDAQTRPFELEKLRLANAQTGVQTQGMQTNNDIKSFGLVTAQRDDTQAQARLAAQPEAAKLLADVRMLASSGDPAKVEQARGMIANGTQTLINAGYKAEAVSGLLDAERAAGLAGFGYKKEVLDNQKFWENQGISQQARDLAFDQINAIATPDVAIRSIQENTKIKDPRIKAQAIQVIQQAADEKVFATADPAEQLIRSLGVQYNVPQATPSNVNPIDNYIASTMQSESRGDPSAKNPNSSATGLFQWTDGTWAEMMRKHPELGLTANGRGDSAQEMKAMRAFTEDNARILTAEGVPINEGSLYAAHFLGAGDAPKVWKANNSDSVSSHVSAQVINANPFLRGMSVEEFKAWATGKGTRKGGNGAASAISAAASSSAPNSIPAPGATLPVGSNGTNPAAQLIASIQEPPALNDSVANNPNSALFKERLRANGIPVSDGQSINNPNSGSFAERMLQQGVPMSTLQSPGTIQAPTAGIAAPSASEPLFNPNTAPARALTEAARPATTPTRGDPATNVQNLIDQSTLDRVFNRNSALISEITNNPNRNETPAQTAARLIGEGGLLPSGNQQAVLAAINETIAMSGGKLTPSAAGAIVANNAESRDLTDSTIDLFPWVDSWFDGDRFSSADESRNSATRTNMEGVAEDLRQLGLNVDGSIELSRGTSQIANQRQSTVSAEQLPQIQALLLSASSEAANIMAAIKRGQDTPANRAALARALQTIQQLEAIIGQVGVEPGSPTTIFSGAGEGLPAR